MSYGECMSCLRKAELNTAYICPTCELSRRIEKASKDASSSSSSSSTPRYVYVDNREWWEKGWVWFWLIVCWPIGYYGLYKRYPKTMIRLGIVIIVLYVLSRIVDFFKGLFD